MDYFFWLCAFVLFLGLQSAIVHSFKINITNFENCAVEGEDLTHFVKFDDFNLERDAEGLCDTLHARYHIPTVKTSDKLFDITMYRCPTGSTYRCMDNPEKFYEEMHCERFQNDNTGPWSMIADGMTDSHCGQKAGTFEFKNAKLKHEYISNFMVKDVDHARHRMDLLIRKKGEGGEGNILRACLSVDFELVF